MLRKSYLKGLNWEIVSHLLFSLSIVLSDRYLFRSMNNTLADQRFYSYEDLEKRVFLLGLRFFFDKKDLFVKRGNQKRW